MSAAVCTRAPNALVLRALPPLRLRSPSPARPRWRGLDTAPAYDRARILPPCGAELGAT